MKALESRISAFSGPPGRALLRDAWQLCGEQSATAVPLNSWLLLLHLVVQVSSHGADFAALQSRGSVPEDWRTAIDRFVRDQAKPSTPSPAAPTAPAPLPSLEFNAANFQGPHHAAALAKYPAPEPLPAAHGMDTPEASRATQLHAAATTAHAQSVALEEKSLDLKAHTQFYEQRVRELLIQKSKFDNALLELEGTVPSRESELAASRARAEQTYAQAASARDQLAAVQGRVAALEAEHARLETEIAAASTAMEAAPGDAAALAQREQELAASVVGLKHHLEAAAQARAGGSVDAAARARVEALVAERARLEEVLAAEDWSFEDEGFIAVDASALAPSIAARNVGGNLAASGGMGGGAPSSAAAPDNNAFGMMGGMGGGAPPSSSSFPDNNAFATLGAPGAAVASGGMGGPAPAFPTAF